MAAHISTTWSNFEYETTLVLKLKKYTNRILQLITEHRLHKHMFEYALSNFYKLHKINVARSIGYKNATCQKWKLRQERRHSVKGPWNVALSINILLKNFNTKTLKPCPRNNLQEFQPAIENCLKCQHHNLWT